MRDYKSVYLPLVKERLPSLTADDIIGVHPGDGAELFRAAIAHLREIIPNALAEELNGVQEMGSTKNIVDALFANGKSEEWLLENGYEPLCPYTRVTWVKKGNPDGV